MEEKVIVTKRKLTAIGDNIRNQTKTTKQYTLDEMANMKLGGSDTSDATATSEDILLGKTAYVNDVKVVGTIEDYDGAFEGEAKAITGFADGTITEYSGQDTKVRHYAFETCNKLTSVDLPSATNVGEYAFDGCEKLTSVNIPKVTDIKKMAFYGCIELTNIKLPKVTSIANSAFYQCTKLISVDLPSITSFSSQAFANCRSLKVVIIRQATQVCSLPSTNVFYSCYPITRGEDGYIYVPRSMVDSYKSATNWSTYASQIRALEDYTVDGTTTGELDESKI